MSEAVQIGFVAALEREIGGAVRGWQRGKMRVGGREQRIYTSSQQQAVLICAGTGRERAYAAAQALIEEFSPRVLVSVGFAGSCVSELAAGAVVVASRVVEASSGREFACAGQGTGTVVTLDSLAGRAEKQQARERFGAVAVEMEAAGVADASAGHGREFAAIKAISDGAGEEMEFLSGFVTPEGFAVGRFVAYVALRPALWPRVAELGRNSRLAAGGLEGAVRGW
jgi:nucleoside phosphorylase